VASAHTTNILRDGAETFHDSQKNYKKAEIMASRA
jgi:hypothetical protein